jgi:O-antigen/teichoic acid export membrane protein
LSLVGAVVSAALNIAFVIVVTRSFTKGDAGLFFSATSLFVVLYTVARLGAGTGVVYFIARFRSLGQQERIRGCLRAALRPVLATALGLGAALFVLAPRVGELVSADDADTVAVLLRILAVFLPLAALSDVSLAATRGFASMRPLVAVEKLGRPSAQLLLLLLVVVAGGGSALLTAAWVAPYLPAAVLGWFWLGHLRRNAKSRLGDPEVAGTRHSDRAATETAPQPRPAVEFWRFTAPRAVASVAQAALQRLDIVLITALRGPAEAAIYAAATRFLVVGQLGSAAISTAVQPRLSALLAHRDLGAVNTVYRASTCWLVLITWPLYLLFAVLSTYVLAVFGGGYAAGAPVMVLLALTMLVATGCGLVDVVLAMAGRTTWNLANALLALALNVVLNLLLIPPLGILGAAIAWAGAIVLANVLPLLQLGLSLRLHPFSQGTLVAAALAAGCFGVVPGLTRLLLPGDSRPLLAAVAAGAVAYAVGLWLLRRPLQLDALRGLRRGSRSKRRASGGHDDSPLGATPTVAPQQPPSSDGSDAGDPADSHSAADQVR